MKKFRIVLTVILIFSFVFSFASCSEGGKKNKMSVVCAGFAEYDWTRNIIGGSSDKFDITYLLDDGSDPHSFQPSIIDMATISDADLFIYAGGESNTWAKEIISGSSSSSLKTVSLYDLFASELIETSNSSEDHDHEDHNDHNHASYDEHLWLSLKNAVKAVSAIRDALIMVDPEGRDNYTENCRIYSEKLQALDEKYSFELSRNENNTVIFADRFPFSYLARDYSLNFYAAYSGCSADSELSENRIVFLADKMDELGLEYICVIETSDGRLAKTVGSETKKGSAEVLTFESCQSVSAARVQKEVTYLEIMETNLELFIKALG